MSRPVYPLQTELSGAPRPRRVAGASYTVVRCAGSQEGNDRGASFLLAVESSYLHEPFHRRSAYSAQPRLRLHHSKYIIWKTSDDGEVLTDCGPRDAESLGDLLVRTVAAIQFALVRPRLSDRVRPPLLRQLCPSLSPPLRGPLQAEKSITPGLRRHRRRTGGVRLASYLGSQS